MAPNIKPPTLRSAVARCQRREKEIERKIEIGKKKEKKAPFALSCEYCLNAFVLEQICGHFVNVTMTMPSSIVDKGIFKNKSMFFIN